MFKFIKNTFTFIFLINITVYLIIIIHNSFKKDNSKMKKFAKIFKNGVINAK